MEDNKIIQVETVETKMVQVSETQLQQLLKQNRDLKSMTIASTDAILIMLELFGGKFPTGVADGIKLMARLPKIIENFDDKKKKHVQESLATIAELAPNYMTPEQMQVIEKYNLLQLIEKK